MLCSHHPRHLWPLLPPRQHIWPWLSLLSTRSRAIPQSWSPAPPASASHCRALPFQCRTPYLPLLNFFRCLLVHSSHPFRYLWTAALPSTISTACSQFVVMSKIDESAFHLLFCDVEQDRSHDRPLQNHSWYRPPGRVWYTDHDLLSQTIFSTGFLPMELSSHSDCDVLTLIQEYCGRQC